MRPKPAETATETGAAATTDAAIGTGPAAAGAEPEARTEAANGAAFGALRDHETAGWPGVYCSSTMGKFVPPKPKALTPARRVLLIQGSLAVCT